MIRPEYVEPDENESSDEICLHNIRISDEYKNTETLIYSFMGWFKNDDDRDFGKLEDLLRKNNMDTHLIAKRFDPINIPEGAKITIPNDNPVNNEDNYFQNILLISCRPKEDAVEELLKYHPSYEFNIINLEKTGSIFKTDNLLKDAKDDNIKDIINCKKKYRFIKYTDIEALGYIISDLEKQFGKKPVKTKVGNIGDKEVYGLVVDGMIRSPILFCKKGENDVELVDARQFGRFDPYEAQNNEVQN